MDIISYETKIKWEEKIKPIDSTYWADWTKIGQKVYHPFKFIDKI